MKAWLTSPAFREFPNEKDVILCVGARNDGEYFEVHRTIFPEMSNFALAKREMLEKLDTFLRDDCDCHVEFVDEDTSITRSCNFHRNQNWTTKELV